MAKIGGIGGAAKAVSTAATKSSKNTNKAAKSASKSGAAKTGSGKSTATSTKSNAAKTNANTSVKAAKTSISANTKTTTGTKSTANTKTTTKTNTAANAAASANNSKKNNNKKTTNTTAKNKTTTAGSNAAKKAATQTVTNAVKNTVTTAAANVAAAAKTATQNSAAQSAAKAVQNVAATTVAVGAVVGIQKAANTTVTVNSTAKTMNTAKEMVNSVKETVKETVKNVAVVEKQESEPAEKLQEAAKVTVGTAVKAVMVAAETVAKVEQYTSKCMDSLNSVLYNQKEILKNKEKSSEETDTVKPLAFAQHSGVLNSPYINKNDALVFYVADKKYKITRDEMHKFLDNAGLIPGVIGDTADTLNAVLYAQEGEWLEVGLLAVDLFFDVETKVTKGIIASGGEISQKAAKKFLKKVDAEDAKDTKEVAEKLLKEVKEEAAEKAGKDMVVEGGTSTSRPTWRQSELDAATDFPDYDAQKSFINGEEVPYGTKGSVRPDYYKDGFSVDIKNYNVESASGRSNLARNIEKQYYQRIENLPDGTKQSVMIDVRGQNISDAILDALYDDIMQRTNNGVEILFKMD